MSGAMSRRKGRNAEREFKAMLRERDWVVHDLTSGAKCEDLIATSPDGVTYSVEVKHQRTCLWSAWRAQAIRQAEAARLPWMLGIRIDGEQAWIVQRKGERSMIWHKKTEVP